MAKQKERDQAIKLRKNGCSISSIATTLNVSKSTASMWCKEITLTDKQLRAIAAKSKHHATLGLLRAAEIQRNKRIKSIDEQTNLGKEDVGAITRRDLFMVGLGLYWGEGYKKGSQELGFTNSDPLMLRLYIQWLEQTYAVSKHDLIFRVSVNDQHSVRSEDIERYWQQTLHIPKSQFTKTSLIRSASKKKYLNESKHYGTLRIKVRKGTNLRRRILGSIAALTNHTTPNSLKTRS